MSNCNFNGHVALHAHVNSVTPDLRKRSSTHINYKYCSHFESSLTAEIGRQNFLNSLYIYITPSNQHFKASRFLNSILRQVFFINFSRGIQISQFESHERLFICLFFMIFIVIYIYLHICLFMHLYTFISTF